MAIWSLSLFVLWGNLNLFLAVNGLRCYQYETEPYPMLLPSPRLPGDARIVECPADQACTKGYLRSTQVQKIQGIEVAGAVHGFVWGCLNYKALMSPSEVRCGDTFEAAVGEPSPTGDGSNLSYIKHCLCCTDLCNSNSTDNNECSKRAVFTKECYGHTLGGATNVVPGDAVKVRCTERQHCYKYSARNGNRSYYSWGCASIPRGHCGLTSSYGEDAAKDAATKMCTCCGDLCNGHEMDSVLANSSQCNLAITTPIPVPTFASSTPLETTKSTASFATVEPAPSMARNSSAAPITMSDLLRGTLILMLSSVILTLQL